MGKYLVLFVALTLAGIANSSFAEDQQSLSDKEPAGFFLDRLTLKSKVEHSDKTLKVMTDENKVTRDGSDAFNISLGYKISPAAFLPSLQNTGFQNLNFYATGSWGNSLNTGSSYTTGVTTKNEVSYVVGVEFSACLGNLAKDKCPTGGSW